MNDTYGKAPFFEQPTERGQTSNQNGNRHSIRSTRLSRARRPVYEYVAARHQILADGVVTLEGQYLAEQIACQRRVNTGHF